MIRTRPTVANGRDRVVSSTAISLFLSLEGVRGIEPRPIANVLRRFGFHSPGRAGGTGERCEPLLAAT
jgi:hypothetical protein